MLELGLETELIIIPRKRLNRTLMVANVKGRIIKLHNQVIFLLDLKPSMSMNLPGTFEIITLAQPLGF